MRDGKLFLSSRLRRLLVEACSTRTIFSLFVLCRCNLEKERIEEFDFDGSSSFLVIVLAVKSLLRWRRKKVQNLYSIDSFFYTFLLSLMVAFLFCSVLLFFFTCIDRDRTWCPTRDHTISLSLKSHSHFSVPSTLEREKEREARTRTGRRRSLSCARNFL